MAVDFEFKMNIEKAEEQADGWYIKGVAAGTDIDLQSERLAPEAINRFVSQINQTPIPFKDWHRDNTVTAEIGEVVKAWVEPDFKMGVEIRLDEDHPTAALIWKKIQKGKQYGMSVAGKVLEFKDEYEKSVNRRIRTFYNVALSEISITTKPIYSPSFGTVLRKATDESLEGDTTAMPVTPNATEETPVVETDSTVETPNGVEKSETPESTETETSVPENVSATSEETEVEKAVSPKTVADARKLKKILQMHRDMSSMLAEFVIDSGAGDDEPEVDSTPSEPVTTLKAEVQQPAEDDRLEKAVQEITELRGEIEALRGQIPAIAQPPVLQKSESDELREAIDKMDTRDKLRFGLRLAHGE